MLGCVERGVGAAQHCAHGIRCGRGRHADADGNAPLAQPARQIDQRDLRANLICDELRIVQSGIGQRHDEFFAAEPAQKRRFGHRAAQLSREEPQCLVADLMAVLVVDALEMIDVDDEDRAWRCAVLPQ